MVLLIHSTVLPSSHHKEPFFVLLKCHYVKHHPLSPTGAHKNFKPMSNISLMSSGSQITVIFQLFERLIKTQLAAQHLI